MIFVTFIEMNDGQNNWVNEELKSVRAIVQRQATEIEELPQSTRRANAMVDAVRDTTYALITEITDAQQKVNSLAYANPRIVERPFAASKESSARPTNLRRRATPRLASNSDDNRRTALRFS